MEVRNVLVVRFRQMGDAVLATPLLCALQAKYPEAHIDFVLNERIAPLFEGHPAIHRIMTFTDEERHSVWQYIKKVWQTVHHVHYDVIIDMRSTVNTMLFALFSPSTPCRIGIRKPYTWLAFNHRFEGCEDDESMIDHNLKLLSPLGIDGGNRRLMLKVTNEEQESFRNYMQQQGIDFARPVALVGVTAKLADKTWAEDRMTETLRRFMAAFPTVQLIFNFAPGREAENARRIDDALGRPANVFINIEAKGPRQLAAMAANCTFYFGNEGGARHIVQAMGRPSLIVCSPMASKRTWLPENDEVLTRGIAAADLADVGGMSYKEQYDLITVERVWPVLQSFYRQIEEKDRSER